MKRILVIGIGNILMKDDGIGVRVTETIQDNLQVNNIVSIIGETDFQYCFNELMPDDFVIIIDAMVESKGPGSINVMLLSDALNNRSKFHTQHELSLLDLIELYYPKTEGYLIGIETSEIDFGLELSKSLSKSFDKICTDVLTAVLQIVEEYKKV